MHSPADLDPHEFDSLNREFYRADPAEAIEQRLWMLTRFIADDDLEVSWPFEDLSMRRDEPPSEDDRVKFACLESMVVAHHAAETLLRLCLAHWDDADCPWWELTKLRKPGIFPKRVRGLRSSLSRAETIEQLLHIVSWSGDEAMMSASTRWAHQDGWDRHREGLRDLVEQSIQLVLDGAELYNAAKHGLAIVPAQVGVRLGEGEVIDHSGPALTVIERQTVQGDPRWAKTTHWIRPAHMIALTFLLARAIRSLWNCGMQRRVGGGDQKRIAIFDAEEVASVRLAGMDHGFSIGRMSEALFDMDHPLFSRAGSGPEA